MDIRGRCCKTFQVVNVRVGSNPWSFEFNMFSFHSAALTVGHSTRSEYISIRNTITLQRYDHWSVRYGDQKGFIIWIIYFHNTIFDLKMKIYRVWQKNILGHFSLDKIVALGKKSCWQIFRDYELFWNLNTFLFSLRINKSFKR